MSTLRLSKPHRLLFAIVFCSPLCAVAATLTNFTLVYPPGYRMVSNPLVATNNDVSNLFQNPPANLTLFKRNVFNTGYDVSSYDPDLAGWTAPMSLVPGEGAFLLNPSGQNYTNTFYGEIVLCSTNPIPIGFSIRSQVLPTRKLTNFPIGFLDALIPWNEGAYSLYVYDPDVPGWSPAEPSMRVGEAFWIFNNGPPKNWIICVSEF